MKKTITAVLATLLASMCLVMIGHTKGYDGIRAEAWEPTSEANWTDLGEEDLISHYTGDYNAYLHFLYSFFCEKYRDNPQVIPDYVGKEAAKVINLYYNDMSSHPYLWGKLSEETGEITILGLQVTGFKNFSVDFLDYYTTNYASSYLSHTTDIPNELVIPDAFNGHPITAIAGGAFDGDNGGIYVPASVVIGDNVRTIESYAFNCHPFLQSVTFGKNVQTIGKHAFANCGTFEVKSWGENLTTIEEGAFAYVDAWREHDSWTLPPFPDTLKTIGKEAFAGSNLPETITIPQSVETISCTAFHDTPVKNIVILNHTISIQDMSRQYYTVDIYYPYGFFDYYYGWKDSCLYCYSGSATEAFAQESCDPYQLIDGDALLWDGKAVEGNALKNCVGMTEAELRSHLDIDGTLSEIQIDGLRDGKVVDGTTVTLFHTVAQAPGKMYTVRTPGDADGDGELSLLDVARLVRYLAGGWNVTVDVSNADVNADGLVNLKDAALLRRFLAGWDVTLL